MKDLLDKLSSYNLFNYLFPGFLFSVMISQLTDYNIIQENIFVGAFLYYFIGLIISRIGSIFVEPFLKKTSFLKFAEYKDFVDASKKDDKIELFSEVNNMYRTLISMFSLIILTTVYELIEKKYEIIEKLTPYILVIVFLFMFLFAYKKQTNYTNKRIEANK